jgi:hypothetical protein
LHWRYIIESRAFITEAAVLIEDIKNFQAAYLSHEEEVAQGTALQKRLNQSFAGLQNPTLPSAYKLRDAALGAGFFVDPKRQHLLASFENLRG